MRYMIDEQDLEPDTSLMVYRVTIRWATSRGDSFELNLQRDIYDDMDDVKRFCKLGTVTPLPPLSTPDSFFSRVFAKIFRISEDIIQIKGNIGDDFIDALTDKPAPRKAVSGDVSPVEDVKVLIGKRILYASYDYGRTQVLYLNFQELKSLRQALKKAGLDPSCIVKAPPYGSKDSG